MSVYVINIAGTDFFIESEIDKVEDLLKLLSESVLSMNTGFIGLEHNKNGNPIYFRKDKVVSIQKYLQESSRLRKWKLI